MLSVGVIGIGNAGSQIATLAHSEGIDAIAINSSERDLSTIPDEIIKIELGDLRGAGKNRTAAKEFLEKAIAEVVGRKDVTDFLMKQDIVFITSSTGGGTGSGIAPLMYEIITSMNPDIYVILVGVLPSLDEAYTTQVNTIDYMGDTFDSISKTPTYMFYDNNKLRNEPTYRMMNDINRSIVNDMLVIQGRYCYTTKYSSIDEKDMAMIVSTPGRIVVTSYEGIKEKDLDNASIDETLERHLKEGTHVELQTDRVIKRIGVIANLEEGLANKFDDKLKGLQEFVGSPVEEFSNIAINTEKAVPNTVYFIGAGLNPPTDRIEKINERIAELDELQKADDVDRSILAEVDVKSANEKRMYREKDNSQVVNMNDIFSRFKK